ncbi:TPA: glycoside hydrolase family 95 [Candidatus Sumerlaeota bacterium]|jgi:alpha-L-fucosidase 2|nr:glycoside hydrolase family 95 [Candidatus Sumerlaeota bacterium]
MKLKQLLTSGALLAFALPAIALAGDLTLWYDKPAKKAMYEALPIGGGRIGGMVFGETQRERIQLNEDSLWTGTDNPTGDDGKMGDYQTLGDLFLGFTSNTQVSVDNHYRRSLDISTAVAKTEFMANGAHVTREAFASSPAQVIAVRWNADKPGMISGTVELVGAHKETTGAEGSTLSFKGALSNGMQYETMARVIAKGGKAQANGNSIALQDCDEVIVLLSAGTDYVMDYSQKYKGENPHARILTNLEAASKKTYDTLKSEHVKDFQTLFNRVSMDLGKSSDAQKALPTDKRAAEAVKTVDPELEALMFQYGRYLLISCSRPGGLPANLQGLWNDSNKPAWHSDYHTNINIQMNYWPAESANISECHLPLFDLVKSQLESWRKATAEDKEYSLANVNGKTRGFAIRTSHNITGGMGWNWDKTANAWYCQHFWEHYAFTGDKKFLKEIAYPVMKETCEFWEDHLKALPDGSLVVPNGWSPEHGPHEDGVSYNQQIVWDLFNNYVEACDALGTDKEYRNKVAAMRDKLVGPKVGKWGQLQEWMDDKDDPNDHHRHTSHLFGVFPGRQIGVVKTPSLAEAAKVSLKGRGNGGGKEGPTEWSFAWRTSIWARLHDGEMAHEQIQHLFGTVCVNLFGNHPPMQMDGNFGVAAGIAEMLLQSHEGEINLLPALPTAWATGSVTGLRARGGFEVDIEWKDGVLVSATIRSKEGGIAKLRYKEKTAELKIKAGKNEKFTGK